MKNKKVLILGASSDIGVRTVEKFLNGFICDFLSKTKRGFLIFLQASFRFLEIIKANG